MRTGIMSTMKSTLCFLLCFITIEKTCARFESNLLRDTCDRKWEFIFSHDESGNVTFGSKAELRQLAMTGNYIKANLYLPDSILQFPNGAAGLRGDAGDPFGQTPLHILQLPASNINKRGEEICFQSLKALSHNGTHDNSTNPWLSYMVCTTGHVTERDMMSSTVYKVAIDWYFKDICNDHKPIYSNYLDGSATHKSRIEMLQEAAKHMGLVGAMRDKPYVFPLDNVMLDTETGEVNGQNVNHIGQQYVENYITFHQTPYHWFSHWSNIGQRDNARWAIQGTTPYIHNADSAAVDWYADICWRWVYSNDETGADSRGSVAELIGYIEKGHKVRVRFDDVNYEVSNIRIKNNVVSAQITHEVTRVGGHGTDRYFIEPATRYKFTIVHTTGKVNAYSYLVGHEAQEIIPAVRKSMEWSVDTRPWVTVLETVGPPIEVTKGSPLQLRDAIMSAASIRLKIQSDPAASFFIDANNVRLDYLTDTVYAQAMEHISDKISRIPNEYELQPSIYQIYYTVSSEGTVRESSWYYGSDDFRADETLPSATVTWFANE